jgi:hypothetical protein
MTCRRWLGPILAAALFCTGCAARPVGDVPGDESFTKAAGYEPKDRPAGLPFSVTDRGRQIERDFGVR